MAPLITDLRPPNNVHVAPDLCRFDLRAACGPRARASDAHWARFEAPLALVLHPASATLAILAPMAAILAPADEFWRTN